MFLSIAYKLKHNCTFSKINQAILQACFLTSGNHIRKYILGCAYKHLSIVQKIYQILPYLVSFHTCLLRMFKQENAGMDDNIKENKYGYGKNVAVNFGKLLHAKIMLK